MKITCPTCAAAVAGADINIVAMSAVCRACGDVFAVPAAAQSAGSSVPATPGDSERPRLVALEESRSGVRMSWRWWTWAHLFLVFFCIAWDGFLVFWYAMALFAPGKGGFAWLAILFPICHVAVGVGLTYFVIASAFNRTVVTLDAHELRVRHGPMPWLGNRTIERKRIHRLKLSATVSNNRSGYSTTYGLLAELDPDGQQTVIRSFQDAEHATYVARMLAARLEVPLIDA